MAIAASISTPASKLFSFSSLSFRLRSLTTAAHSLSGTTNSNSKKTQKEKQRVAVKEKRRTRSDREFELESIKRYGDTASHIPVMLGEVMDVFSASKPLRRFVDCTVGAAGHSSAMSFLTRKWMFNTLKRVFVVHF